MFLIFNQRKVMLAKTDIFFYCYYYYFIYIHARKVSQLRSSNLEDCDAYSDLKRNNDRIRYSVQLQFSYIFVFSFKLVSLCY